MSDFNLFFLPPEDLSSRARPEKTHILSLQATPYPDGRRVRVNIETTPFQVRPHIEVVATNAAGDEVASVSIVEPLSWKIEFTLHLRDGGGNNPYNLQATLFYPEGPSDVPRSLQFSAEPE